MLVQLYSKDIISSDAYTNFMALHVAMLILLSTNHENFLNYARELLEYFVKTFEQIYGSKHCSYNVHAYFIYVMIMTIMDHLMNALHLYLKIT